MHKIEYEIQLNENGRPYIELSKEYEDKPDDKFFVVELTRHFLHNVYQNRGHVYNEESLEAMKTAINLLGQISDEMAYIIYDGMLANAEIDIMFDIKYHVTVNTIDELDNRDIFIENSKIYKKMEGLKVFVKEESQSYLFENNNWKLIDEEN
jgi:hypothetical protein